MAKKVKKKRRSKGSENLYTEPHLAIYFRVSTDEQTTDSQVSEVDRWMAYKDPLPGVSRRIYEDLGISGSKDDRPALNAMLEACRRGYCKAVVVYKLDRLTRNTRMAIQTLVMFDDLGIEFYSVTQPYFARGNPFYQTMRTMFAEFAEMERDNIRERVKAGVQAAIAKGTRWGPPIKATEEKIAEILALRNQGYSIKKVAEQVALSVGTVHKVLKNHD